jgi:hypothetical protein
VRLVPALSGTRSDVVCVIATLLCWPKGGATTGRCLHSQRPSPLALAGIRAARYRSSPATRLMVVAKMTANSRYDSSAWPSAAARNVEARSAVSDTWKVIPTVKAR